MPRSPTLGQARTFLALAILCAACMVYYHLGIFVPRAIEVRAGQGFGNGYSFGADFYPIWRTSREVLHHHCDPYAPEMTRQIQIGLFGRSLDPRNPAASPEYRGEAGSAANNGFHGGIESGPDDVQWVQVDLGTSMLIDRVVLWPARPYDFAEMPGFISPVRFKIEVADDPSFANPRLLVADFIRHDFPNPGTRAFD